MAATSTSGVHVYRGLVMPLADGPRLSGDLSRPLSRARVPVLVSYHPYRAAGTGSPYTGPVTGRNG